MTTVEMVPLVAVVDHTIGGGTPQRDVPEFWNGGIPWATVKDFKDGSLRLRGTQEEISERGLKFSSSHLIPAGNPIICTRMAVGRVAIADKPVAINQDLRALVVKDDYDVGYVLYAVDALRRNIENASIGSTVKGISVDRLVAFEIARFPKPEQTKIAELLLTVDRSIEQTGALIAKQQRIKAGLMQDLLTKGIDEQGNLRSEATHEFKDSTLGRIPVEWGVTELQHVLSERPRNGIYKPASQIGYGVLLIGQTSFTKDRRLDYRIARRALITDSELKDYRLMNHDILVTRVFATVEGVGLPVLVDELPEAAVYESNMLRLRIDENKANAVLIFHWLKSPAIRKRIVASVNASNQTSINQQVLNSLPVMLISPEEQWRIVSAISSHEYYLRESSGEYRKLQSLKTALMQDLLTGKKRVTPLLETATTD